MLVEKQLEIIMEECSQHMVRILNVRVIDK